MNYEDFILRLFLAFLLGSIIGFERQWQMKSAGLRTNTLVSVGSAAFILLSVIITKSVGDPSRIAAQIVTGIGFLGAGVILRDGLTVQGLNTAATIWCSSSVGSLAGFGLYKEAAGVTFIIVMTHILYRPVSNWLSRTLPPKNNTINVEYLFTIKCTPKSLNHIRLLVAQELSMDNFLILKSITSEDSDNNLKQIKAIVISTGKNDNVIEKISSRLSIEEAVTSVSWEMIRTNQEL